MSRTIARRAILYWVASLGVFLALNAYVALHPLYGAKARRVDDLYRQLEGHTSPQCSAAVSDRVVVIGNSYVAQSFLPPDECGYAKVTVSGMPLQDAVGIVEHLGHDQRPKAIVVGVGYNEANPVDSDSSMYMRYWAGRSWERLLWRIPLVRARGMALSLLREDLVCLTGSGPCVRAMKAGDDSEGAAPAGASSASANATSATDAAAADRLNASIRRRYSEYRSSTQSVSAKLHDELGRIVKFCAERHIRLILYTAPIAPQLKDMLGSRFVEDFHREVRLAGAEYHDLNSLSAGWDASYFNDATHVSRRGAEIVTAQLLQALNQGLAATL